MVVHDLNFVRIASIPDKADAVLIIDANAVLPFPVAAQSFQMISWRDSQIAQLRDSIQNEQLAFGYAMEIRRQSFALARPPKLLGSRIRKTLDHGGYSLMIFVNNVNRY
jgi:hypothetical protein